MTKAPDNRDVAKVFRSGHSQAVHLPAARRFETSEIEAVRKGERVALPPRGKSWAAYFDSKSRGSLPERCQPPLLSDV